MTFKTSFYKKKERSMLTKQNKADIYDLLKLGFKEEEKIPLASLALYLNNKKFSYQEYGYKKLKSLLNDLSFLSYETNKKNHNDVYVVLHHYDEEENKSVISTTKKEKQTLSELEKKKIIELLLTKFEPGEDYSLSTVSKYLSDNSIDYKKYNFPKMRKLIESLNEIVELKEDKKNKSIVTVHFIKLKKKTQTQSKKKNTKLPEPNKGCFFIPNNLILSFKEITSSSLSNDEIISNFIKDYKKAYQNNEFKQKDDAYIFSLSMKTKEDEPIIASIKKAYKGSPYTYYLNFIGTDKEKAKDCFLDKIYFENIDKSMNELSALARKEKWCYHNSKDKNVILKIYLQYTFYQVYAQNKFMVDEKTSFACFNTGLKSPEYEDIYAILIKNNSNKIKQEFIFQGFSISASQGLGKVIIEHFNPLPQKATYFDNFEQCVFDSNCEIHTDIKHIIMDNIDRFPIEFLQQICLPFKEEQMIIEQICHEKIEFKKEKLFSKLEKCLEKNETLFTLLKISLEASISKAIRMVNYDYRNALPSFFPTRNVMSMMIPLEFTKKDRVEAVLLIEKTPSGNYQGQTILTLKQCYVNARLISPLENTYLDPSKIED